MKNFIKLCLLSIIMVTLSCNHDSLDIPIADIENTNLSKSMNSKSTVPVVSPNPALGSPNGTSTLHRNKKGITVNFKTDGLIPGHAVTIWWVIWNNPEECSIPWNCGSPDDFTPEYLSKVGLDILFASGHVIGGNGMGNFSGHLNLNDDSGSANYIMGLPTGIGGLHDSQLAEVHIVVRTHGPKVPGIVNEQIDSYDGGCDDPLMYPPFSAYPDAIGECADIFASIHASALTP